MGVDVFIAKQPPLKMKMWLRQRGSQTRQCFKLLFTLCLVTSLPPSLPLTQMLARQAAKWTHLHLEHDYKWSWFEHFHTHTYIWDNVCTQLRLAGLRSLDTLMQKLLQCVNPPLSHSRVFTAGFIKDCQRWRECWTTCCLQIPTHPRRGMLSGCLLLCGADTWLTVQCVACRGPDPAMPPLIHFSVARY